MCSRDSLGSLLHINKKQLDREYLQKNTKITMPPIFFFPDPLIDGSFSWKKILMESSWSKHS